jgi:uncharacterized repeat protein (TIGR03803 family)
MEDSMLPHIVSSSIVRYRQRILQVAMLTLASSAAALLLGSIPATAQTETILYTFPNCDFGCNPGASVALDQEGNLYSTASVGVFKVSSSGTFTYLGLPSPAEYPEAGVTLDSKGNIFGTSFFGGTTGYGTVFEMNSSGVGTVLYNFTDQNDGAYPSAGVVLDSEDNAYGTTTEGGNGNGGVLFEVTPSGTETTLYNFVNGTDGGINPVAGVVRDSEGNLYGTTITGGTYGFGTIYKVTPAGVGTILHSFNANGHDGIAPWASLVLYKNALYGTTQRGGTVGVGTVFKMTESGYETILHSFTGGTDGIFPYANLIVDSDGNLYGTTTYGGSSDLGTVFKVTPSGVETVLHSFANNSTDGRYPFGGLAIDSSGNLYGTASGGGNGNCEGGCGVVFKIVP